MDKEHGNDTELLIDIMKCNGVEVVRMDNEYLVTIWIHISYNFCSYREYSIIKKGMEDKISWKF